MGIIDENGDHQEMWFVMIYSGITISCEMEKASVKMRSIYGSDLS
jgi:hypothetical protein